MFYFQHIGIFLQYSFAYVRISMMSHLGRGDVLRKVQTRRFGASIRSEGGGTFTTQPTRKAAGAEGSHFVDENLRTRAHGFETCKIEDSKGLQCSTLRTIFSKVTNLTLFP